MILTTHLKKGKHFQRKIRQIFLWWYKDKYYVELTKSLKASGIYYRNYSCGFCEPVSLWATHTHKPPVSQRDVLLQNREWPGMDVSWFMKETLTTHTHTNNHTPTHTQTGTCIYSIHAHIHILLAGPGSVSLLGVHGGWRLWSLQLLPVWCRRFQVFTL